MKMNIAIIGISASLLFASQSAFAQEASIQKTSAQSTATQTQSAAKTTKRVVKTEPVIGQKKTVQMVGKTRVIHSSNTAYQNVNLYRGSAKKTSTPNLYRE